MGFGAAAPWIWSAIAALGSSAIGGLLGGDGPSLQERKSFEGTGDTDPRNMLSDARGLILDALTGAMDDAAQPVTVHTTVNPVTSYHGDALPMGIGVQGMDPNRLNPALRTIPGFTMPRRRLDAMNAGTSASVSGGRNRVPPGVGGSTNTPGGVDTGREAVPRGPTSAPLPGGPDKTQPPYYSDGDYEPTPFSSDDAQQAALALQLALLRPEDRQANPRDPAYGAYYGG